MTLIKKQKEVFFAILLSILLWPAAASWAAEVSYDPLVKLNTLAAEVGLTDKDLPSTVGKIINIVLSFLGIIFFVLIVYAGIMWMTSGGNEQKVAKAKETIVSATIGLAIVMISYGLSKFIMASLTNVGIIS